MDLDNINNSVFKLKYCLVLATRKGKLIMNSKIIAQLIDIFKRISVKYNIKLEEYEYSCNNIRLFFTAFPNSNISKFLNTYKSASSRLVRKDNSELNMELGNEGFWDMSYCLLTLNSFDEDIITYYLKNKIIDKKR